MILLDTGVFSASISRRRRARSQTQVGLMAGRQVFLAVIAGRPPATLTSGTQWPPVDSRAQTAGESAAPGRIRTGTPRRLPHEPYCGFQAYLGHTP